ncbi:MAG TPA: hypothetical protein VJS13_01765 [Pyrinomonadaceae bacterium]|nr:hypothetical protein [Pyrinomonadaceae bacterium]
MKQPRSQLVNVLIGKSILEIILVGTLAVVVYLHAFPPTFQGWGEIVADTQSVAGWAVNYASPWDRVEVQLFIDDKLYSTQMAQFARPDVSAAGWAKDEWHGYNFPVSGLAPGNHEARVYALHKNGEQLTLQLLGNPIQFAVSGDGTWQKK